MPLEQKSYASNSRFEKAGDINGKIAKRDAEMGDVAVSTTEQSTPVRGQWVLGVINNLNPN